MIIKVDKKDTNRILLTELMPYETPILFSNEGFYHYCRLRSQPEQRPQLVDKILTSPKNQQRIPYLYQVKKDESNLRTLSVIHPVNQIYFVEFYERYSALILHLCSKSPISLRFPAKIASHFYRKGNEEKKPQDIPGIEIQKPGFYKEPKYSSSFFSYQRYPFLHKFYDSLEFIELEKKFENMLQFDIANCFDKIYTHSISWAVKDKAFSKAYHDRDSFEREFDTLMQKANYNETNGILVGSEIARIFAEIILQRIDLIVVQNLEEKGIKFDRDYCARRYVDDYFVFVHDDAIAKIVLAEFRSQLLNFKLHINENKTSTIKRPLISQISMARIQLERVFNENVSDLATFTSDEVEGNRLTISSIKNVEHTTNGIIRDIKSLVRANNVEYSAISRVAFAKIKTLCLKIDEQSDTGPLPQDDNFERLLLIIIDIVFFICAMDFRVINTYTMTQILITLKRFLLKCSIKTQEVLRLKIHSELNKAIENVSGRSSKGSVEFLNFVICVKAYDEKGALNSDDPILALITDALDGDQCDYFTLLTFLHYIENDIRFFSVKQRIERMILEKIASLDDPFYHCEFTLMFFDIVRCPFVTSVTKESLVENAFAKVLKKQPRMEERNYVINYIGKQNWWFNWSETLAVESMLEKKELSSPY